MSWRPTAILLSLVLLAVTAVLVGCSGSGAPAAPEPSATPTATVAVVPTMASAPTGAAPAQAATPSEPAEQTLETESATLTDGVQGLIADGLTGENTPTSGVKSQPAAAADATNTPVPQPRDGQDEGSNAAGSAAAKPPPTENSGSPAAATPPPTENSGSPATATPPPTEDPRSPAGAPRFQLPSVQGEIVSLESYAGQRNVVLIFYRGFW